MTTAVAQDKPAPTPTNKRRPLTRFQQYSQIGATVVLLVIMLVVGSVLYPNFTSGQAVLDLFSKNSFLIVLAIGMTFVILTGGIDLSVGAVMALGTVVAATLLREGWPAPVVIPVVLLVGGGLGFLVGLMIHHFKIQPFIATLAAMFLARGLCLVITDRSIAIDNSFFQSMNLAHIDLWETTTTNARGRTRVSEIYTTPAVLIALAVLVIAFVVLHYTRFGRTVYALGGGEASTNLMGLSVARTKIAVYTISGLCAGLAGILFSFYTASGDPVAGIGYELNAIAAVVIGGTLLAGGSGYVLGSLLGVLTLGVIYAYKEFDGDLNTGWTRVMIGVLVLFFIVLQRILIRRRR
ncbi:simple sugar transport system permease protein [Nakamurella flavida]|uniref:ABC transporter permease subunit n=1 Tax=Nakamurella flavida TaxID=363630 RepID=UPI00277F986D|nr:ABC transporter permease [Nakamurella flavida]MDP9778430.1 simple sugar transport system permease protein [Nakamurella flavida]